uniref:Ground-like domain-containing protein n=1 Tax=Caenorhabditis japonica TaxID=281687 RepID=A0A8R1HRL9_CAEJA
MKLLIFLLGLTLVNFQVQGQEDTCPSLRERLRSKPGKHFCCDSKIKTVVETGMKTLDLFGVGGPKTLGPIVQALSQFVQRHFQVAYEVIMAPKDFQLNTNYNGTKLCKFESNNYMLAVYETPGDYDINSPEETYFYNFAANDKLRLPDVAKHISQRLHNAANLVREGAGAGSIQNNLGGFLGRK